MDDASPTEAEKTKLPYIPHDLVTLILARLPPKSLGRFSCVCKAWRSSISDDASFRREVLRLWRMSRLRRLQTASSSSHICYGGYDSEPYARRVVRVELIRRDTHDNPASATSHGREGSFRFAL